MTKENRINECLIAILWNRESKYQFFINYFYYIVNVRYYILVINSEIVFIFEIL